MENSGLILVALGSVFLLGLAADAVGRQTRLPRVSLLILMGLTIGPSVLNLLPQAVELWYTPVANIALAMIGFLLGGKLTISSFASYGREVVWISVAKVLVVALVVFTGLLAAGASLQISLLLSGIAAATAPASTAAVVDELETKGRFSQILLRIVAIDDAWALILFSVTLAICSSLHLPGAPNVVLHSLWELGGALLIGIGLGIPMAFLTGRVKPGEPTLIEALGLVFLCSGVAIWIQASFILACIIMGGVIVNLAKHHNRPFHAIEEISWPFMVLFFILSGAALHLESFTQIGFIGTAYIVLRFIGGWLGAWSGAMVSHCDPIVKRWMGLALMPQAGVAIGMALVATQVFPELRETILPIVLGSTVFFELLGPILTRVALSRAGER
ncbi:MAG: cation:proton antiporter [Pseudomonadota bacterium]